jgi:hypothetical protein
MREGDKRIGVLWYLQASGKPDWRDADIAASVGFSGVTPRNRICAGPAHDHTISTMREEQLARLASTRLGLNEPSLDTIRDRSFCARSMNIADSLAGSLARDSLQNPSLSLFNIYRDLAGRLSRFVC